MEPDDSIWLNWPLLLLLILCGAFFAMSEQAILSLSDQQVRKMAQEGNPRAKLVMKMTQEPSRFVATTRMTSVLFGFLAAAVAAVSFASPAAFALRGIPISGDLLWYLCVFGITAALSFFFLLLADTVPRRLGSQYSGRMGLVGARLFYMVYTITGPLVALLSVCSNGVLRLFGVDPHQDMGVTEEEIRMLVDEGGESGTIDQGEKDMINNIFEFDDRNAGDMMTHRTEITAVEVDAPLEEIVAAAVESGYSRIPVYRDDLDTIVGILYVKDLLGLVTVRSSRPFQVKDYLRKPFYVLESTSANTLLGELKTRKLQMAVVVDEYGGTSGLVTMEDLLESIVGNIQDEYDDEEEEITDLGEGRYLVDGLATLDDVLKYFELELEDADEYDTIGGYIISQLDTLPEEEECPAIAIDDVLFTVQEMDERRVSRILACRVPQPAEETAAKEK